MPSTSTTNSLRAAVAVLLALALGCSDDLPEPSLVANLRILGVQADPPEAAPGDEVALSALVLDTPDAGPSELVWIACPPSDAPILTLGPEACASGDMIGTGPTTSFAIDESATDLTGDIAIFLVAARTDAGGVQACLAALSAGTSPDFCRVALKRIAVVPAGAPTAENPALGALVLDGDTVTATLDGSTPEGEAPFLSWFVTAGELAAFRTQAAGDGLTNTWTLPAGQSGTLAVVLRDNTGAQSWHTLTR